MKKFKTILTSTVFLAISALALGQSADEIINKYIQSIGGKDKLSKINSLYIESKMEVMGMEFGSKSTTLNGKGFKTEMDAMGSTIITCLTDKGGWSIKPMSGGTPEDMGEAQYNSSKDQIFIGSPFTILAEKGYKAEMVGKQSINNIMTYKLKVIAPDKSESQYFFDSTTGYLIKAITKGEMQGEMVESVTIYSDYRSTDGYTIPFKTLTNLGGKMDIISTITKVEINKPVAATIFAKPI